MKKRVLKTVGIISLIAIAIAILVPTVYISCLKKSSDYVDFNKDKLNEVYSSLTLLDNRGNVIAEPLYLNGYKQIPLDALHDYTYMAFVAVEDKRFFEHNGIDFKRIIGATAHNVKSGRYKEGASTISQQLIKNTHLTNGKTIKRKVNEMLLSYELEKNYSKKEILEMYLNTIYFGRNAYGIETAANVYFNKSAKDLTVSESAILAGMIKAPNNYAPDKNKERCKARRDSVLRLMKEQNIIDETQFSDSINSEIVYSPEEIKNEKTYSYFVMQEACKILNITPLQLAKSDFVIETYCDAEIQQTIYEFASEDKTLTADNKQTSLSCFISDTAGGVVGCYYRGNDPYVKRQVGSTLKPIAVYAPALNEKIITQASPVLDEETNFNGYIPTNAGGYNGWTTIKTAVAKSLNVPAVKTLNSLGIFKAQKYLQHFGIKGDNLSLALGNSDGGIDCLTLLKCYAALSNDGKVNDTAFIKNIYNSNGVIYSRNTVDKRVFSSDANYLMTDLLLNTTQNGTSKKLFNKDYQIASKTGTVGNSNGNTDAIVAGYTAQNAFVCWYSGNLPNNISGSTNPCILTKKILDTIYEKNKPCDFVQPQSVIALNLDKNSLYNNQLQIISSDGEKFLFSKDNKPKKYLQKEKYDYKIEVKNNNNGITVILPQAKGEWKLYSQANGKKTLLRTDDKNIFIDTITHDTVYFAELYLNDRLVYTTPKVQTSAVRKEESTPFFWNFRHPK